MTLSELFYSFLMLLTFYGLWGHVNMSAIARASARKHCRTIGVQLLDQNIILKRLSLHTSRQYLVAIGRLYLFEFSSVGDSRYTGTVKLIGNKVVAVELEAFKSFYETKDDNY